MLHLLKRLPRKIAVSRMAKFLPQNPFNPQEEPDGFYLPTVVVIIVPLPLHKAVELRLVYIQFVFRELQFVERG